MDLSQRKPPVVAPGAPPGLILGYVDDEHEIGLLFYDGASRNLVWVHPGYGVGRYTDLSDPAWASRFPLRVALSCGNTASYANQAAIPPQELLCPCGNPNHALVFYYNP